MFPIHNHSEYSALDGFGKPEEIAARIEQLGLPGCCLTDHGTVAGFAPFVKAMTERNLQYGLGIEAYQARTSRKVTPEPYEKMVVNDITGKKQKRKVTPRDGAHLILLAKNDTGFKNLMRLSDEASRTGFYYHPRVDWELLEKYHEGIICTSACLAGLVAQGIKEVWEPEADNIEPFNTKALSRYLDIFGDDFFLEMHTYSDPKQHIVNEHLVDIAQERGVPVVYANDAHYCKPSDYIWHETLLCMQQHKGLDEEKGKYASADDPTAWHPQDLFIMGEDDVRDRLSYLPDSVVDEAVANSDLIAERCAATLPEVRTHLPVFKPREKVINNNVFLLDLVEAGLKERYEDPLPPEIEDRAIYEYESIVEAGLGDYFLIVWDFINWCRHKKIMVGPGRGSAGGSILAYALGITSVDPIKYGLYFERFWNPGRTDGLPDIDVDIEKARRAEVKQYLANRYGENRVLPIGNHIRMRPKQAIDKAGMALWGKSHKHYGVLELIKKQITKLIDAGVQPDWETIWEDAEVAKELQRFRDDPTYEPIFAIAEEMTGRLSSYGVHASAVVISDVDLPEYLPCRLVTEDDAGQKGDKIPVTQLEMVGVEDAGFPKFDLLGLKTLDVLKQTCALAGEPDFDFDWYDYDNMPIACWQMLENGHTLGLFQIEDGYAARKIASDLHARNIEDLAAIVALNRPGPLRSGMVDRYLARRAGKEATTYAHEMLEPILKDTYGDFLYQEQVIAYFRAIGYDLGEADAIRKMLGKKQADKMAAEHPRYLERATQFMSQAIAEAIWEDIIGFSKYSFNKSHAVEYGKILAQTMLAKFEWPTEFIMACIEVASNAKTKASEKVAKFVQEGRKIGVPVLPPDINMSDTIISKVGDEIYFGLRDVKGVGDEACDWIKENRPFKSFEAFQEAHASAQKVYEKAPKDKRAAKSPKQLLRANAITALYDAGAFDSVTERDISAREASRLQLELLGIMLLDPDADLAKEFSEEIEELKTLLEIDQTPAGRLIEVPGIITEVRQTNIRADASWMPGERMAIIHIRWQGQETSFAAFPDEYRRMSSILKTDRFCRFSLKRSKTGVSLKKATIIG